MKPPCKFNIAYIAWICKSHLLISFLAGIVISQTGCKKLVETDPPVTTLNEINVYADDASAISVLTGIYTMMSANGAYTGNGGISVLLGLSADELSLYSGVTQANHIAHYRNALLSNSTQTTGSTIWNQFYRHIFVCNAAIEGITASGSISESTRQQLLGEARFMRAFLYFYLINLYGDVPLILTTDPSKNASLGRSSVPDVYRQIIADLIQARSQLNVDYLNGQLHPYGNNIQERIRPTRWAAAALLARTYLHAGNWANAEKEASLLIDSASFFALAPLNEVFLMNSAEAIWQLQPVVMGHNSEDGWVFVLPPTGPSNVDFLGGYPVYLSPPLLNSFEMNDDRRSDWIDSLTLNGSTYFFPYKYKNATLAATVTEYQMVLRLGEQFLIRAEARAQQDNIAGALNDLNAIRIRAGLMPVTAGDKASLLAAILHERQVELFTEWGARWLDLKRSGVVDNVMTVVTPQKGGAWEATDHLFPIPFADLQANVSLAQNPGY